MRELPDFLRSETAYRKIFNEGLIKLLDHDTLNLFILVCANASFDEALFAKLQHQLRDCFEKYRDQLFSELSCGKQINEADDDLLVFLKMALIGFESLQLTQSNQVGGWEVQFNHLRSFRPYRNASQLMTQNHRPFDNDGFSFNKPFLQQESIWKGRLLGVNVDVYYNKFPFAELHALLVPEREQCQPQLLTESMHKFAWGFASDVGNQIPDLRLGYNAMGAYASVNHLHFQLCVKADGFALENTQWCHNGGNKPYPVNCRVFDAMDTAWQYISDLHKLNQTYNLLYTPGCLYCIPREFQGAVALPEWSPGFSWYEMAGGFVTSDDAAFRSLSDLAISNALAEFSLQ